MRFTPDPSEIIEIDPPITSKFEPWSDKQESKNA